MQTLDQVGEQPNKICTACKIYPAVKNSNHCESCGPLIKALIKDRGKHPYVIRLCRNINGTIF